MPFVIDHTSPGTVSKAINFAYGGGLGQFRQNEARFNLDYNRTLQNAIAQQRSLDLQQQRINQDAYQFEQQAGDRLLSQLFGQAMDQQQQEAFFQQQKEMSDQASRQRQAEFKANMTAQDEFEMERFDRREAALNSALRDGQINQAQHQRMIGALTAERNGLSEQIGARTTPVSDFGPNFDQAKGIYRNPLDGSEHPAHIDPNTGKLELPFLDRDSRLKAGEQDAAAALEKQKQADAAKIQVERQKAAVERETRIQDLQMKMWEKAAAEEGEKAPDPASFRAKAEAVVNATAAAGVSPGASTGGVGVDLAPLRRIASGNADAETRANIFPQYGIHPLAPSYVANLLTKVIEAKQKYPNGIPDETFRRTVQIWIGQIEPYQQ